MKFTPLDYKSLAISVLRLFAIMLISLSVAAALNRATYNDYYSKKLFKLHTSNLSNLADQMTIKLNFFLSQGSSEGVQSVLDASFGLFGYVVTDCSSGQRNCPEQKILYTSSLSLPWNHPPDADDLLTGSFAILRRPPGQFPKSGSPGSVSRPGDIIGRLYVINNMPHSFSSDYFEFIKAPFKDTGARRFYLRTTFAFMAGALIIWALAELYFMLRSRQQSLLRSRELDLKQAVNRQLKLLSEKDAQIIKLNEQSGRQFEAYLAKIRALNLKIQNEEEYRQLAEQIIDELEQDKAREAEKFSEDLTSVRMDMERLQQKVTEFEQSSKVKKDASYKALEEAVRTPNFSNVFEQRLFEAVAAGQRYKKGDWRLLSNYDVAPGRNYRQFTDFILFNGDALIILEAKYYVGTIESPGDFLNDIWISTGTQRKVIDSLWGENPYHQLNEYSMSLMKILKQKSPWNFQIFGVIIFPDEADISRIGEHIGKFYRVCNLSRAPDLFENIFAEARRFQAAKSPRRPKPEQVEDMLRGRKISS